MKAKFYKGKSLRPVGGGSFLKLEDALRNKPGITNPGALAAVIGRNKVGQTQMTKWSVAGRKRNG